MKHWKPEEAEKLMEMALTHTNAQLAVIFNTTEPSVQRKLQTLHFQRQHQKVWTTQDCSYLKRFITQKTMQEFAEYFGTSVISVKRKCHRLGISYGRTKKVVVQRKKVRDLPLQTPIYEHYNIHKEYQIGDRLYHPIFNDVGIVEKKLITHTGIKIIIVNFNNKGKVKLVESCKEE